MTHDRMMTTVRSEVGTAMLLPVPDCQLSDDETAKADLRPDYKAPASVPPEVIQRCKSGGNLTFEPTQKLPFSAFDSSSRLC